MTGYEKSPAAGLKFSQKNALNILQVYSEKVEKTRIQEHAGLIFVASLLRLCR